MKSQVLIRIAIIASVILLCLGGGISLYYKMNASRKADEFDLYKLVPPTAQVILDTDDVLGLIRNVNNLNSSKDGCFLYFSRLFSQLKENANLLLNDAPHGFSSYMNKMVISFHQPESDVSHVMYCRLGAGDHDFVEKIFSNHLAVDFPVKHFSYKGEQMRIYPMQDDHFLVCYIKPEFMAVSYEKKLIEEVIDAHLAGSSILTDTVFTEMRDKKKNNLPATIYLNREFEPGVDDVQPFSTEFLCGWTEFTMKLSGDGIYLSGSNHHLDSSSLFTDLLCGDKTIEEFPQDILPSRTIYFQRKFFSEISGTGGQLDDFIRLNSEESFISCFFLSGDTVPEVHSIINIPVRDELQAIDLFNRSFNLAVNEEISGYIPAEEPIDYIPVYHISDGGFLSQYVNSDEANRKLYACFIKGHMILSSELPSLIAYISTLKAGDTLHEFSLFAESFAGLSRSYNFLVMADFEEMLNYPGLYSESIPEFFYKNNYFFRHFIFSLQYSCLDGMIYPNILLLYKG